MNRLENGLAWTVAGVFVAGSLPEHQVFGKVGEWTAMGLRESVGSAGWLVSLWSLDVARRTFAGCSTAPRRALYWALFLTLSSVSLGLLTVSSGGWLGGGLAGLLSYALGVGARIIVFGTWAVIGLRLLGAETADRFAEHATQIAVSYRLSFANRLTLPVGGRVLDVIDTEGETVVHMPPVRAPVGSLAPVGPAAPAAPVRPLVPVAPPPLPAAVTKSPPPRAPSSWDLPSVELLALGEYGEPDLAHLHAVASDLTDRLGHFRIAASVMPAERQGAVVSRYEVSPAATQELKAITARVDDLSAAYKGLRFVPMQGTGKIGIEIPLERAQRQIIPLRDVFESDAWRNTDALLPLALGVTSSGDAAVIDLAACPHLLVGGSTNSGKSVAINSMIVSLLMRNSPSELQLILIDPKVVEFPRYRGLPHLLTPVITETQEAIDRLAWACDEMDRRYRQLADADAENLMTYNEEVDKRDRMPRIVIVIDEYADLTCVAARDPGNPGITLSVAKTKELVEGSVIRLAQKARAAGIHVVLATQRPSVDVLTGAIKANFPSRISFKTAQRQDSSTIIGSPGAEKLLGDGDSLCLIPSFLPDITRVHGAFVAKSEVKAVVNVWAAQTLERPARRAEREPAREPEPETSAELVEEEAPKAPERRAPAPAPAPASLRLVQSATPSFEDRYERSIGIARERGYVSGRVLSEELRCNNMIAKRLIVKMLENDMIAPGGPNNSYRFIGDEEPGETE